MYYTVIKHDGHLRTLEKCRKHSPAARVFYFSLVFSNDHRVLSQCNTRLRLLYLLNNSNSNSNSNNNNNNNNSNNHNNNLKIIIRLHCINAGPNSSQRSSAQTDCPLFFVRQR